MGEIDRLRRQYGPFEVREETFTKSRKEFETMAARARRGVLGGARVLVEREGRILLVRVRDEFEGWDVVGGKREAGETPCRQSRHEPPVARLPETHEETARREAREEVGLDVTLTDVFAVNRFAFTLEDGDGRVSGLWVLFDGTCSTDELDVQESELFEARWFAEPPGSLNKSVESRVARWRDECD